MYSFLRFSLLLNFLFRLTGVCFGTSLCTISTCLLSLVCAGRVVVRRRRAALGAAHAVHSRKRQAFDRRRPVAAEHSGDGSALGTRFLFCQHIIVLCFKLRSLNACCTFSSSGCAPSSVFKVGTVMLKLLTCFQFLAHTCYYNMCVLGR